MQQSTIILITDSFPAANGGGISQTLYNLLDNWDGKIDYIARPAEKPASLPAIPAGIVNFNFERYRSYSTRFLRNFNRLIQRSNFSRLQKLQTLPATLPAATEAWVLVSTTEPVKLLFAWLMQQRFGYKVVPYFMDDWMSGLELKWKGNSIQVVVADLLRSATCWLMISRQLEQTLRDRYCLAKKPSLVVHNPSPDPGFEVQEPASTGMKNHLKIVYAGSIWPMHLDALAAVAKAVTILNLRGEKGFTLVIYTGEATWQQNRKYLESAGVVYGGYVPFGAIHSKMALADLLLVTASFEERYQPLSRSSVQTKLTDYIAVGKPVLYVGPPDGASGQFVHDWDCGYSINTSMPQDVAAQLAAICSMPEASFKKGMHGLAAARTNFSKAVVQQKFYGFLKQYTGFSRIA